mgnify:CR=1 FL=1
MQRLSLFLALLLISGCTVPLPLNGVDVPPEDPAEDDPVDDGDDNDDADDATTTTTTGRRQDDDDDDEGFGRSRGTLGALSGSC